MSKRNNTEKTPPAKAIYRLIFLNEGQTIDIWETSDELFELFKNYASTIAAMDFTRIIIEKW
jgi:hypothetical protein